MEHQYVERASGLVRDERLFRDAVIRLVFAREREDGSLLYRALTSGTMSRFLAYVSFDGLLGARISGLQTFLRDNGIDLSECLDDPKTLDTPRKVFERRIRYWETRPMVNDPREVVSPADSRMIAGSFDETDALFIKGKFFDYEELFGVWNTRWITAFRGGDFALFRLTPDKYHYNHVPASGTVVDHYALEGRYAPCNPAAVIRQAGPYSKNRRDVTVIDTDVDGGTRAGLVAMIEVAAMMVGDIVQAYSDERYEEPRGMEKGLFLRKGQPKSLFRPGSSTVVLVFEKGRVAFHDDILANLGRTARSRYSLGLGRALVETEVAVRSAVARTVERVSSHA